MDVIFPGIVQFARGPPKWKMDTTLVLPCLDHVAWVRGTACRILRNSHVRDRISGIDLCEL